MIVGKVAIGVRSDIVQWDVPTWWRAFEFFEQEIERLSLRGCHALEIGARDGGTALYLARFHNINVLATDIDTRGDKGRPLHLKYGVSNLISYDIADATNLSYEHSTFDLVVVKSVLGGIGSNLGVDAIRTTVAEIDRVLKPGGVLLFAENLRATAIHRYARNLRAWRKGWYYPTPRELESLLSPLGLVSLHTTGLAAVFVPDRLGRFKFASAVLDAQFCRVASQNWQYVGYGSVVKPRQ